MNNSGYTQKEAVKELSFDLLIETKLFGRIKYKDKVYKKSHFPTVGGIALSHITNSFLTAGKYYLISDYVWRDGRLPSLIGDDKELCGLYPQVREFRFTYYI